MTRTAIGASLIVLIASEAFGQSQSAAAPAFEVASIRASQSGKGFEGGRRENIQFSPDSVIVRNGSLKACIGSAYHVMDYQISGPEWMGMERYDIVAKSAAPASEEQLRKMLQTLLAERFKLALHHQTKELPAYILLVAKNGPKLHESQSEGESSIEPDKNRMVVVVRRAPVSQLTEMLSRPLRAPMLDETGLKGRYDVTIDAAKYIPTDRSDIPPDPLSIITTGLQQELGLRLESRRTTLDLLIIDHAEKVPTEN